MTPRADPIVQARRYIEHWQLAADPDELDTRLIGVADALEEARAAADGPLIADAWRLHLMTLLEAERVTEIYHTLGDLGEWCRSRPDPDCQQVLTWLSGLRAILDGDPQLAETLLAESISPRESLGPLTTIRCFQGRIDELEAPYLAVRRDEPAESAPVLMLAWIWAQQHRMTAVRGVLDTLGPVEALPRDRDWLLRMSLLADISVLLDDRPLAEQVYRMLSPYPRRIVLIGNGFGCWGTTDRSLGVLARHLGRRDDAIAHFTAKIELSAAAAAHPWLVRGQLDMAELLLDPSRPDPPRLDEAAAYIREGLAGARRLDYPALQSRAEQLTARLHELEDAGPRQTAAADATTIRPVIDVIDGFEVRATTGEIARWNSRKASELVCILVAHRGRAVPRERVMEYLWPGQPVARLRNRLAVAVSTARRALDPGGRVDREQFIATTRDTIRLRTENVDVDAEVFLRSGAAALAEVARRSVADAPTPAVDGDRLRTVLDAYRGEPFADAPYAEWASSMRDECAAMQVALLHAVIETSSSEWSRAESARQILAADPYDERANRALVEALQMLGARGVAESTQAKFHSSLE